MMEGEILLDARGLMKAYRGRRVVNNVNINVRRGEVVGILGPNGAGKTTSFYMITGLIKPDAGVINFKGIDVSSQPMYVRARMGMGYLAQDASIFRKCKFKSAQIAKKIDFFPSRRPVPKPRRKISAVPSQTCAGFFCNQVAVVLY